MKDQRMREIVSILMESPLYFCFSLSERRELVKSFALAHA